MLFQMPTASASPLPSAATPAAAAHAAAAAAAMQNSASLTSVSSSLVSPTTVTVSGMTPALVAAAAAGNALQSAVVAHVNASSTPSGDNNNQSNQKDTVWTKLFVGGLPYHTTDKSLREHFEVYGDIDEAVVITDRQTGKSRGYGFVIMGSKEAAEKACKEPNPIIDGRKANVNLAVLGAKPRVNSLQAALPLATALRQGFPTLIPGHPGEFSLAASSALPFTTLPTAAALAAQAAQQAVAANNQVAVASPAPGKARSSMSLQLLSGRMPPTAAVTTTTNPYLQSMYAAAATNPYAIQTAAGLIPYATSTQSPLTSTGNPMLDIYNQYAALAAGAYTTQAGANVNGLDAASHQPGLTSPAGYLPAAYYTTPAMTAASLGAHYASAAVPTQSVAGQAGSGGGDNRLQ